MEAARNDFLYRCVFGPENAAANAVNAVFEATFGKVALKQVRAVDYDNA
jgi:hypothetical protein